MERIKGRIKGGPKGVGEKSMRDEGGISAKDNGWCAVERAWGTRLLTLLVLAHETDLHRVSHQTGHIVQA